MATSVLKIPVTIIAGKLLVNYTHHLEVFSIFYSAECSRLINR